MSDLVTELDNSMMRKSFGVDASGYPKILYRRDNYDVSVIIYRRDNYDVSVKLDTHIKILGKSEFESDSGRFVASKVDAGEGISFGAYSGSTLNFSLKGKVREGASEDQYREDMHALKSSLNGQFKGNGVSIDTFVCMPFNGGQEIKLSNLVLYYKKETPKKAIANAVALVQERVYNLLSEYIQ